jgi:hypothetical protein
MGGRVGGEEGRREDGGGFAAARQSVDMRSGRLGDVVVEKWWSRSGRAAVRLLGVDRSCDVDK